jgi:nucleotide-binding universal stress UspA family protein
MLAIRTILHPTDFSACSDFALRLAASLARDYDARLVLLHVIEPLVVADIDVLVPPPWIGLEALQKRLQNLRPRDVKKVQHRIVEGYPATEIANVAKETKSDLIVLGTHGRTGLKRVLMGSVAEQVLRKASCPVLTVKSLSAGSALTPTPNWAST